MRNLAIFVTGLMLAPMLATSPLAARDAPAPDAPPRQAAATPAPMPGSAMGSARTAPDRRFTGADLFDLAAAADPQISPDGRHIAYVRRSNDIMTDRAIRSIWLIDTQSGAEVPIAGRTGDAFSPRWSPDGRSIAYTMLVKDESPKWGAAPANKPEGAKWADPLEVHDLLTYRADGAGYVKPGFEKSSSCPPTAARRAS